MPVLRVRKGKNEGEAYAVFSRKLPTVIGRGEDNEVCLDDNRSSRKHAQVVLAWGNWLLQDLGSSNGTLLNGEKVDKARLTDQATVQVGNTLLVFQEHEDPPTPRREIYGSRLLETAREESGLFVYNAYQSALDRPVRIDLFAAEQLPSGELLETVKSAVDSASELKHDLIDGVVTSDFSDSSKSYLVQRSHGGVPLGNQLEDLLAEPLEARLQLVSQLLTITLEKCRVAPGICGPLSLDQFCLHPAADGRKSLSASALELPTLLSTRSGSLCHIPAYTNYLPPEFCEEENGEPAMPDKSMAYSAAAVSYLLLTGTPVMGEGDAREILRKHQELKPAPASLINSDIPEELSDLLSQMLEKEPAERPSAAELIEPVITVIENNRDVIEVKGDFKEESTPEDLKPAEKDAPPLTEKSSPIPAITRSRLERNPGPGLASKLATLPLWAILWGGLFYGSWQASHMLFKIFIP
jgi:hypothetical protein